MNRDFNIHELPYTSLVLRHLTPLYLHRNKQHKPAGGLYINF